MRDRRSSALDGAAAGVFGTAVLATVSRIVTPRLPESLRPSDFVPGMVVRWAVVRLDCDTPLPGCGPDRLAMVLHLTYGGLMGALYGAFAPQVARAAPLTSGAAFGVALWAVGFQGWLPALGILPRTTAVQKWAAPILGHIVYGSVAAVVFGILTRRRPHGRAGS